MNIVTSKDGTAIAFDQHGAGPTVILVGGALQHRAFDADTDKLAALLAPQFTVFHYDRRGRGDSGDTLPYAVEREIEDLDALISAAGGSAFVFGISSGAALGLKAAVKLGNRIKKLAMYEAAYESDDVGRQTWMNFTKQLTGLLAANRRGEAVSAFLTLLGTSAEELQGFSHSPVWPLFEAVAPTLAYDVAILGETATIPLDIASRVSVPTLLMHGGADSPYLHTMRETVMMLAKAIPHAQYRVLAGQTHFVDSDALAPVLAEFFSA
jgi:pimeloyl-ACP methyl ester carboxylesterase